MTQNVGNVLQLLLGIVLSKHEVTAHGRPRCVEPFLLSFQLLLGDFPTKHEMTGHGQ